MRIRLYSLVLTVILGLILLSSSLVFFTSTSHTRHSVFSSFYTARHDLTSLLASWNQSEFNTSISLPSIGLSLRNKSESKQSISVPSTLLKDEFGIYQQYPENLDLKCVETMRPIILASHATMVAATYDCPYLQERLQASIDPKLTNFVDTALGLHCTFPSDFDSPSEQQLEYLPSALPQKRFAFLQGLYLVGLRDHVSSFMGDWIMWAHIMSTVSLLYPFNNNPELIKEYQNHSKFASDRSQNANYKLLWNIHTDEHSIMKIPFDTFESLDWIITDYHASHCTFKYFSSSLDYDRLLIPKMKWIDSFGTQEPYRRSWTQSSASYLQQLMTISPDHPENSVIGIALPVLNKTTNFYFNRPYMSYNSFPKSGISTQRKSKTPFFLIWGKVSEYLNDKHQVFKGLQPLYSYLESLRNKVRDYRLKHNITSITLPGVDTPLEKAYLVTGLKDLDKLSPIYQPLFADGSIYNIPPLSPSDYDLLTSKAMAFAGVGYPMEGLAHYYAMRHGTPFINPLFHKPIVLPGKPTQFAYNSAIPLCEQYGPPFTYNVPIDDRQKIENATLTLLSNYDEGNSFTSFIPLDFIDINYMIRMNQLFQWQTPERMKNPTQNIKDCKCPYCIDCIYKDICTC